MKKINLHSGFTLVEVLIASTIFTMVGLIAMNIFINITRLQNRISLENAIYEDARFMMERLAREIRNNAIDYEEYFNKAVIKTGASCKQFGDMFGYYAAQFYYPGKMKETELPSTASNPGDYGAFCNTGVAYLGQNCTVFKPSVDINYGAYPYPGEISGPTADQSASSALCPWETFGSTSTNINCTTPSTSTSIGNKNELYLISADGSKKTIFARKETTPADKSLGMLVLKGKDVNNDGIFEKWRSETNPKYFCDRGFYCPDSLLTLESTLAYAATNIYSGFVPISPMRTNIQSLQFIINPIEDPQKAFAENANYRQPSVTILMTVKPSLVQQNNYPSSSAVPTLTLQTTVSSRVQSNVKSYLGYQTRNIGYAATGGTSTCP